ncbi:MAG: ammonium transporter, partial [Brevundimonas sp.]
MSQLLNRLPGALALCLLTLALFWAGGAFAQEAPAEPVAAEAAAPVEAATPAPAEPEAAPAPALLAHQAVAEVDGAASSWILTSTALVLLMTLPGLALFYGGMVRRKNVIATITQSLGVASVVTLAWFAVGYSLSFGVGEAAFGFSDEQVQSVIGSLDAAFLNGVTMETAYAAAPGLPEYLWIAFQLTFAIITPALVTGAFAERIKYSALLLFTALWSVFVYAPICHWVWGGGFLGSAGVLDFAGGAVVHVNSGVAGLVCAIFLGARKGYGAEPIVAHNPVLTMIGASLLLVGWIGFNAGSAWAADAIAGVALLNTLIAAMAASLTWKIVEVMEKRKPSLIGVLSGLVAGLVAITPAA